jgi:hypothetical protein
MCRAYEAAIGDVGGLDLVMLGLGPNAHLASNEPGTPFESTTRAVPLPAETVGYILTDGGRPGPGVCARGHAGARDHPGRARGRPARQRPGQA